MYGEGEEREHLRNGLAWIEYRSFEDNSYDTLLYGLDFQGGHELDIVKIDFENQDIDAVWCYTSPREKQEVIEAHREFASILEENYLFGEEENWINSPNYMEDNQVSYNVISDSPVVRGDILRKNGKDLREELDRFSEDLFEPPLSNERHYDEVWVEAGNVFD